jgi:hypothetical protein
MKKSIFRKCKGDSKKQLYSEKLQVFLSLRHIYLFKNNFKTPDFFGDGPYSEYYFIYGLL